VTTGVDPRILVSVPDGWRALPLPPPDLSQAAGVHVLAWEVWGPSSQPSEDAPGSGLVGACLGRDTGTWTAEAEPLVLERLDAMVSSTALRVARIGGYRVVAVDPRDSGVTSQLLEGAGDAEHLLAARTFLGFVGGRDTPSGRLVGCFALCVTDLPSCESSVDRATVDAEFVPPPAPTLLLRAVVSMVHHPSVAMTLALAFSLLVGGVLVATRRRPRTK
jgi:hypothetical protein